MSQQTDETTPASDEAGVVRRRGAGGHFLVQLGLAVLLVLLVRAFLAQSFYVPSGSMSPTIAPGDRVVVAKVGTGAIEPGDIVVFDGTTTFASADRTPRASEGILGRTLGAISSAFGIDPGEQDFLKRVAAVGGQRLSCTPDGGLVRDGQPVDEPYLPAGTSACSSPFDITVPAGRIFLLGDNRADSADSRAHLGGPGGGTVAEDDVIGEVVLRYWPMSRISSL